MNRCDWAVNVPEIYTIYHDKEWGIPVYDDRKLFEMLILEGMQAGLSWLTILKKREAFKTAFDNFDAACVATYSEEKLEELLQNPSIIRNRLKCQAAVQNARAFCRIQETHGSFSSYIWSFTENRQLINHFATLQDVPPYTTLSEKISKELKKMGMNFVGPTIIYSFMQAVGMVNDHITSCYCHPDNIDPK